MAMPIPQVMESKLPADDGAKDSIRFFERIVACLEPSLKSDLLFTKDKILEFPQILASWLFANLQRVRVTTWGVVTALNAPNEVLFVLSIRALTESATS